MAKPLSCILVTIQDEDGVSRKMITDHTFTIGRSDECAIACADLGVSRLHLLVKNKGGKVWVEDQDSANGTYINDERIPAGRLTPVEPADKVRLGKEENSIFLLQTVERAFTKETLEGSALKESDKESALDMIQGAHAEAARVVNLGREIHDKHVGAAEERAKKIEQKMAANHEHIIGEATKQAKTIIDKARLEHEGLVSSATETATREAKASVDRLMREARETADRINAEARSSADRMMEESRSDAEQAVSDARLRGEEMIRLEREKMVREAREIIDGERVEIESYRKRVEADLEVRQENADAELEERQKAAEADLEKTTKELQRWRPKIEEYRKDAKKLEEQIGAGKKELEDLEDSLKKRAASIADLREKESRRAEIIRQLADVKEQLAGSEKNLERKLTETRSAVEEDKAKRQKALDKELTNLRLAELERLKRERASVMAELSREREHLGKKILIEVQTAAVRSMPPETWRKVMNDVDRVIQDNLKLDAVSDSSDKSISPLIAKMAKTQRRSRFVWTAQGLLAGILVFAGWGKFANEMAKDSNPIKSEAEEQTRQMQEDRERRKFNPPQDDEWRDTYANLVIYKKDFVDNYRSQDFQNEWAKTASKYFLKNWKVQEENVVAVVARINTLVGTLQERKDAIDPDHVKEGLQKLDDLEAETLSGVKELLGSEVRIEAFKRLEKKTYLDFFSHRDPASPPSDSP